MKAENIAEHFAEHKRVVEQSLEALSDITGEVARVLVERLAENKKVLIFGNGGSATQASHFAGELLGRFRLTRQPFPAIALGQRPGTVTCIGNDFGYDALFERQVEALAQAGDIAFGFTTSGRSENVRRGLVKAHERGATTVAVTGKAGLIGATADYVLAVPSDLTAHIQEVHLMLLHVWCVHVDEILGKDQ